MTESEMLEIAHLAMSNMLASFAILLTLVSGYLIVAYSVGRDFKKVQVTIINTLFLIMSTSFLFGVYGYCQAAVDMSLAANELNPARLYRGFEHFPLITIVINAATIVASIYFMWHVRNVE